MIGSVKLSYEEMLSNCTTLNSYAGEYEQIAQQVNNLVGSLAGSWGGEAANKFEEDYNVLSNSMKTAVDTMRDITQLVQNYVNSMQEVEQAYGKNHVTIG